MLLCLAIAPAGSFLDIRVASSTVVNVSPATAATKSVLQISEPITIGNLHLITADELESTAHAILQSDRVLGSNNNDANQLAAEQKAGRLVKHCVNALYLGGDLNNWYLATEAQDHTTVEMAFMDNKQEPEIIQADREDADPVFSRDTYRYKVRFEFDGGCVDYRGLYGSQVP